MGVLPIALGLPGTICFLPVLTHHRSPSGCVIEAAYAEKGIIACHLPYGNSGLTSPTACFVDSLLGQLNEGLDRAENGRWFSLPRRLWTLVGCCAILLNEDNFKSLLCKMRIKTEDSM